MIHISTCGQKNNELSLSGNYRCTKFRWRRTAGWLIGSWLAYNFIDASRFSISSCPGRKIKTSPGGWLIHMYLKKRSHSCLDIIQLAIGRMIYLQVDLMLPA
jgi:hypothetical protein